MKCSVYEVLNVVDVKTGAAILYTNEEGLMRLKEGDSFYVWTHEYMREGDIALRVFEKDLSEDSEGNAYCVDGLDVIIL